MNKQRKQSAKPNNKGSIRIIGGSHRGRKLPVLMAEGLRPTTDRVKETVFNWLMPFIQDSLCLDCFAGSGGLGFEALSRGASHVSFVELNKAAAQQLLENQRLLKSANISIVNSDALSFIEKNISKFDIVFIDPPFRKNLVEQTAKRLDQHSLADNALIYIEMESEQNNQQLPMNWTLLKEKIAGQVAYRLYQKM
ncbi:16S rRNA (guanine(966)-N(2))-methyltransferase RsmD [Colwellia sp. PAMC 20917]|jgi:16S rRNA (guanine966-N2)-methyltransferase|uniref:16S rRNA (guanine(966)-N(2))-methyltransferase RsmD n=1 Tax=unclassified Colwellia TaxID=196834 RepID=UPI000878A04E|nr:MULTISPECIES: 16S rRNA (guanine(966)-N(2))-methyltransferase RsmD [unclassified Colwellia]MBA6364624.1 16S rRNA (guanine(966)-N(2))-methyltransferase RsmD [Colwellia sp. BRX8-8]AOW77260.1 16S rRNA (guanine(966)-N(2))-methyltransferase RsmD [Colwellia sp. PAMC 20917]MBA6338250.1 16S rRNA (guanine(966)-N(2))-methyltransferase RsmD [Colwellia sp. BRX8-7]MBA6347804.1 16S rRNA (guanine(966)-N(2))-methyltransferase RsmD [Colwellia sp. BRX8-9]MBA6351797.1 16S rRNA (guanine(966)-N(2))-methyltransfe